jgi:ppGpp synthetase/RelA/SpoT-type nucleotidyltranferase
MNAGEIVIRDIVQKLEADLNRCGIMYHIFYREKSEHSIKRKMEIKEKKYKEGKKKMQDLLALRITLYFTDDVELVHTYLKNQPNFDSEEVDKDEVEVFRPKRLNIVLKVPEHRKNDMKVAIQETGYNGLIDNTYEVQIRTILSEGWHEVEHDLRYKCQEEWEEYPEEARLLNGIYATLENSEWSMLTLFDRLSYSQYKKKSWDSMIRNKMRIRFSDKGLSPEIKDFMTANPNVVKDLFRANRSEILKTILESSFNYPLTYDTVIHLLNHIYVKNADLGKLEDKILKKDLDILFGVL